MYMVLDGRVTRYNLPYAYIYHLHAIAVNAWAQFNFSCNFMTNTLCALCMRTS